MQWIYLVVAIVSEVGATIGLRVAAVGRRAWYGAVAAGYVLSYVCLSLTLAHGLGIGVAYGVWAACGVALTAVASKVFFKEPLTLLMAGGIVLIMGGVLLIELGNASHGAA
ncbi:DMT family transporter [Streptomyces fulvoviolaceus]|uniref:DMT family transporter n=1 Tax=Streptomyces fulvoviolaceus TaxID=285535 RepID=UPI0004C838C3|nr:SMR family transporter [Streptomyces fulvoviolaceus]